MERATAQPPRTPGARFGYDNGAPHVLAACLARALDQDLQDRAERRIFGPLRVTRRHWPRDPDGLPSGSGLTVATGAEAALRPGWRPALDVMPGIVAAAGEHT